MFTWGEIQLETCKKMFLNSDKITVNDLASLRLNNNYKTYFNGMAQAANEGIAEILKRGKPYVEKLLFKTKTDDNLLGNQLKKFEHKDEDIVFEADKGLAYYFSVCGYATIEIYINDVLEKTIENENAVKYITYKDFLNNSSNDKVKIVFTGDFLYTIKNVCIFQYNYDYDDDGITSNIPDYSNEQIVDLDDLAFATNSDKFYKVFKVYYENKELINNTDYQMIDYHTINFVNRNDGDYYILYQPYPTKISETTLDSYELPLEYETAVLLPLYMASQLYKDDDISLATIYRNEFEAAIDDTYSIKSDLVFVDKAGWL